MKPRHHGSYRDAGDVGDLLVAESFDVGQQDRRAELLGQRLQSSFYFFVGDAIDQLRFGRDVRLDQAVVKREILACIRGNGLRFPLFLAIRRDERVRQDLVEPGAQIRAGLELIE